MKVGYISKDGNVRDDYVLHPWQREWWFFALTGLRYHLGKWWDFLRR